MDSLPQSPRAAPGAHTNLFLDSTFNSGGETDNSDNADDKKRVGANANATSGSGRFLVCFPSFVAVHA
jgi:hypothetical protein